MPSRQQTTELTSLSVSYWQLFLHPPSSLAQENGASLIEWGEHPIAAGSCLGHYAIRNDFFPELK